MPAMPLPSVNKVKGSGTAAPVYVMTPRIRLASGLLGALMGVEGSNVNVNVPVLGELKVSVVVDQFTVAPDVPGVIVPTKVALYMPGFGDTSLGTVNVTFKVNVAPLKVDKAVEVALKTPSVTFDEAKAGGSRVTLISLVLEEKVTVVPPTVSVVPPPPTVPPELPAPKLPVVPPVKVTGAAETDTKPKSRKVNVPSNKNARCTGNRIIGVAPYCG